MMLEFTVGPNHYRARKMTAFQQFHVARRLAPVISELLTTGSALAELASLDQPLKEGEAPPGADPSKLIVPFADALSRVSDDDCNYVLGACLGMVQRQQGGNGAGTVTWSSVWNERGKTIMFDDINELAPMMEIVIQVLQDNMTGFFAAGRPELAAGLPAPMPSASSP